MTVFFLRKYVACLFLCGSFHAFAVTANIPVVGYVRQTLPDDYIQIFDANDEQINRITGEQTKLIFLLYDTLEHLDDRNLSRIISLKLQDVLIADVTSIASENTTTVIDYKSGDNGDAEELYIFEGDYQQSVRQAYSQVNLGSNQGQFIIDNGFFLYHTEPKAISRVLRTIDEIDDDRLIKNIVLISQKPMCHCCSRVLLYLLQTQRNKAVQRNILILSHKEFKARLKNDLANLTNPLIKRINKALSSNESGNKLFLLIRY